MKHVIVHNLELARSRQLTETAFADYKERYARYSPSLVWHGDRRAQFSFTAKGLTVTGTLELRSNELEINMDVPLLFRMFKAPGLRILDREVKRILGAGRAPGAAGPAA